MTKREYENNPEYEQQFDSYGNYRGSRKIPWEWSKAKEDAKKQQKNNELRSQLAEWEKAWDKLLHLSVIDPLFDAAVLTYLKRYDPRNKERG